MVLCLWLATAPGPAAAADPQAVPPSQPGRGAFTPTHFIYLPLILKLASPPSVTCFNAIPPSVALSGSSVLVWCVSGALTTTISPGPGVVTGTFAVVTPTATTVYVLRAFNPTGVTTATTTVTVTGGMPCGNIVAVQAWEGTLGFSYSRSGSSASEGVTMVHGGNVSFHIEQSGSGPGGVSWIGFATGNVNINDSHVSHPSEVVTTLIGSGVPISLVQGIEEHSRIVLNVRYSDCSYNFSFDPFVKATETNPDVVGDFTVGSIRSGNRALPGTSGAANFSAHSQLWVDDGSDVYFPPWGAVGPGSVFPNEASLGSASVSWSFSIATP